MERLPARTTARTPQEVERRPKPLTDVVPFGESSSVEVIANPQRLIQDFLTEARRRGLDLEKAEEIARRLVICFDYQEMQSRISRDLQEKGVARKNVVYKRESGFSKLTSRLSRAFANIGYTGSFYDSDSYPTMFLNPSALVQAAVIGRTYESEEQLQAAIREQFYSTWRHEREHLLRWCDPKSRAEEGKDKLYKNITVFVLGQAIYWSERFVPHATASSDLQVTDYRTLLPSVILTAAMSTVFAQTLGDGLFYWLLSRGENKAREAGRSGQNLPDLFDFKF